MLCDLLKHYNEIEKKLELFRIQVANRLGKKVYIEEGLQVEYGSLLMWYAVELEEESLVFNLRVELRKKEVHVDLDNLKYYDSYEYGVIKDCLKIFE